MATGAENGFKDCFDGGHGGGIGNDADEVAFVNGCAVLHQYIGEGIEPRIAHGGILLDGGRRAWVRSRMGTIEKGCATAHQVR